MSGPVLSRLCTKVHEILRQCMKRFVLSSALARLSMSRFVENIFAIKCRRLEVVEKSNKCKSFWSLDPNFFLGDDPNCSTAVC